LLAPSAQTGLLLPLAALRQQAEESDADIALQVASEAENLQAVMMLEQQYDDFMLNAAAEELASDDLPDGDDIAAQVEEFLAERDHREGQG
jgi:hypothetical protein